ncbi:phospholipase D-like protein [Diaminobutyricimonas aerilata]|uniref:Phospholipase D-like protein n=1 Tax=Diaminobutyricimonas aerilata TaxID=1162967 RepID=A0A2M9CGC3_9MICO|nr:PLD nuclease N-terminal domain-containing protein [Diaminobutyricimonas aerilata]PJJ70927.1 phospholipase D-like protein [Diaminobutyricimonas aerilata]
MARLLVVLPFLVLVTMVWAIVDLIMIDESRVRGVNKLVWALIIILLPVIGAALWFFLGRERGGKRPASRQVAPDDDPAFLERLNRDSEERIRKLEQELADLDDDPPATKE